MIEWWSFTNSQTGQVTRMQRPGQHPGFVRWNLGTAVVVIDGVEQYGQKSGATQKDSVKCSRVCELADPRTYCVCSCGGKNHGVSHGHVPMNEEEEAAWDQYVDEEMAPRG